MSRAALSRRSFLSVCSSCREKLSSRPLPQSRTFTSTNQSAYPPPRSGSSNAPAASGSILDIIGGGEAANTQEVPVYAFHVYAHKHNTHITVTKPDKGPLPGLSLSAGNLGFRKASRGTYDAAYQLGSFIISRMVEKGYLNEIKRIEVVLRGFGVGREAVTKVILGQEGERIRRLVTRVTDSTRLKFGGTRSEKPRRLG